jgi:dephospho-CoA kinase
MAFKRIGIAGYMGAGKSTAARILASSALAGGGLIIDADLEAKALMTEDQTIRHQLAAAFGESIIGKDGLSFGTLGRIVFGSKEKLLRLNAIVHPALVRRLRSMLLQEHGEDSRIFDAALLPLWNIESLFDTCIWVHARFETRLERLQRTRTDLSEQALRDRMRMQEESLPAPVGMPWKQVDNNGDFEQLTGRLAALRP